MHQAFDPATAGATSLHPQRGMDPWAAIASAAVLMDLPDRFQESGIGSRALAHRTLAPGVIAGRRDIEHGAHQPHRIGITMVLDEAKTHVRVPAKIAIDFFKMSRSMRSRSFSWRSRAISAAWSAGASPPSAAARNRADRVPWQLT